MGRQGHKPIRIFVGCTMEVGFGGGVNDEQRIPDNPGDWGVVQSIDDKRVTYISNDDGAERIEWLRCCYHMDVTKEEIEARRLVISSGWTPTERQAAKERASTVSWGEVEVRKSKWCGCCRKLVAPAVNNHNNRIPRVKCPVCGEKLKRATKAQKDRACQPSPEPRHILPEYSRTGIIQPSGRRIR